MLALLGNIGPWELIVILVIAVLIFGKDLPQAASKVYLQARKLRNAVDDLRRDSGIERELRNIERTVREAEWEARKATSAPPASEPRARPAALPSAPATSQTTAPEPQGGSAGATPAPAAPEPGSTGGAAS